MPLAVNVLTKYVKLTVIMGFQPAILKFGKLQFIAQNLRVKQRKRMLPPFLGTPENLGIGACPNRGRSRVQVEDVREAVLEVAVFEASGHYRFAFSSLQPRMHLRALHNMMRVLCECVNGRCMCVYTYTHTWTRCSLICSSVPCTLCVCVFRALCDCANG